MTSRQPRTFQAEAVVLRHTDWGEADRLLSLYTRERGKIRAVAKGVRKLSSRKAGHLEPFTHVSLLLATGRDLYIVTQAETIDAYLPLTEDLELLGYAAYVVELLDRFTYEEDENRDLYRLLTGALSCLAKGEQPSLVVRYFEVRLLALLGYRPELSKCVSCETEIQPEGQYFSTALGGVICPRCGPKLEGSRPISLDALRYLRHFQRSSYPEAARARISPPVQRELEALLQHYITHLLERGLNTPAFIRRVRKGKTEQ